MSNLLSRLGARALGKHPQVQPLLRAGKNIAPIKSEGVVPIEETGEALVPMPQRPGTAADRFPAQRPGTLGAPPTDGIKDAFSSREIGRPPKVSEQKTAVSLSEVIHRIYEQPETAPRRHAEFEFPPVSQETQLPDAGRAVTPESARAVQRAGGRFGDRLSDRGDGETLEFPVNAAREAGAMPAALQTPRVQIRDLHPALHAAERSTEVRVNIGRIEIHAAQPSLSQAAPPRKSTGLSLETYLARRRGERE